MPPAKDKDLNERIKAQAEPGVFDVIEWALAVHADTMDRLNGVATQDHLSGALGKNGVTVYEGRFSLDEREEARRILLDYGAGKPARIIEHRGNSKKPIMFETRVGSTVKQLKEPDEMQTIDAEVLSEGTDNTRQIHGDLPH